MVVLLQLAGVVIALGMMFLTYLHFRKKEFRFSDLLVWLLVWMGFVLVVVFPESVNFVLESFSIQGALWFITIISIVFLTILVFYLHSSVRVTQKMLNDMVKEVALKPITVSDYDAGTSVAKYKSGKAEDRANIEAEDRVNIEAEDSAKAEAGDIADEDTGSARIKKNENNDS